MIPQPAKQCATGAREHSRESARARVATHLMVPPWSRHPRANPYDRESQLEKLQHHARTPRAARPPRACRWPSALLGAVARIQSGCARRLTPATRLKQPAGRGGCLRHSSGSWRPPQRDCISRAAPPEICRTTIGEKPHAVNVLPAAGCPPVPRTNNILGTSPAEKRQQGSERDIMALWRWQYKQRGWSSFVGLRQKCGLNTPYILFEDVRAGSPA